MRGLFIVGTDTGVGKTKVTCWIVREILARGHKAGVCKPAVTGAVSDNGRLVWEDAELLAACLPPGAPADLVSPYRWTPPAAPPVAARLQATALPTIKEYLAAMEQWSSHCADLIVEGVGGLLCPLTERETLADLVVAWGRPALIVARLGLGTINHTLLTLEAANARGIKVAGVLLNRNEPDDDSPATLTNADELRRRLDVPVWGPTPHQLLADPIPQSIRDIDWEEVLAAC